MMEMGCHSESIIIERQCGGDSPRTE
jgi:hypothetical protein